MNLFKILDAVESNSPDSWTRFESVSAPEGYHTLLVFQGNVSITITWGIPNEDGESWIAEWSKGGRSHDNRIFSHYFDIRHNGVPIGYRVSEGRLTLTQAT